jgi:hypothetical protein
MAIGMEGGWEGGGKDGSGGAVGLERCMRRINVCRLGAEACLGGAYDEGGTSLGPWTLPSPPPFLPRFSFAFVSPFLSSNSGGEIGS